MSLITKLEKLGEKWANLPNNSKEAAEIADDICGMLPEVLARVKTAQSDLEQARADRNREGMLVRAELLPKLTKMQEEKDKAEKACAEMRDVLKGTNPSAPQWLSNEEFANYKARFDHALSTSCGKDYIHKDLLKPLVEALRLLSNPYMETCGSITEVREWVNNRHLKLNEALAHAAKLMEETK